MRSRRCSFMALFRPRLRRGCMVAAASFYRDPAQVYDTYGAKRRPGFAKGPEGRTRSALASPAGPGPTRIDVHVGRGIAPARVHTHAADEVGMRPLHFLDR